MYSSLVLLCLIGIQGSLSFTVPSASQLARRTAFVSKPFYVATELKSDVQDANDSATETESADAENNKRVNRERHTVFLGNLPFDLNDEDVADLCKQFGKVLLVNVPKNRNTGQPRGFAFVDMSSAEELEAVVRGLDGTPVKGRNVRASVSDPSQKVDKQEKTPESSEQQSPIAKIYVGNLPFGTTKESLIAFYKQFCDPVDAYIPTIESTGKSRGFAFVTLKEEDVDSVIEKTNGQEFEGRPLVVNKPLPPGQRSTRRPSVRDRTKLYVGNLAFTTDVEILEEVFGEFGEVYDCYMPEDPAKGGSRGFGFVTMARENAMAAIAELNGCELDGRFIRVNEALPKGKMEDEYDDEM